MIAALPPYGSIQLPAHVRHVEVSAHGRRLIGPLDDAAYDTCARQSSFVRSRSDLRVVVERVQCWGDRLDNYTGQRLVVRWAR